jgi:ribosomal protein S18 acetylase RimI-like enzyme
MIRPLPRDVGAQLDDMLAPLRREFPSSAAFLDWQAGVEVAVASGRLAGLMTDEAVLLYQEQGGLATILAAPAATDAFLEACLDQLQARLDALIWDAWVGPDWPTRFAHRGLRPYELQTCLQEVARVPEGPTPDVTIRPLRPDDEIQTLLVAANTGTLAGLFLTYPAAPTPEAYAAALQAQELFWEASHVAEIEGRLAGFVLAVRQDDDTGFLYDLATHPRARGRQVGRYLVQAMQASLRELGLRYLRFITTADNAAVHRLYAPESIVERTVSRGGYWLRGT